MKIFTFIFMLFPLSLWAMCEYPHNPPVTCLKGKIAKVSKVKIKDLSCRYDVQIEYLKRPGKTYRYNNNLDEEKYPKESILKKKGMIAIYSRDKKCLKKGLPLLKMAIYNCSTEYPKLKDLTLIDSGYLKGPVHDPWRETRNTYSCQ